MIKKSTLLGVSGLALSFSIFDYSQALGGCNETGCWVQAEIQRAGVVPHLI